MGNKSVSQIVGIGDICIQTSMGCTLTLKDVRHIPDLCLNLIPVYMLDKDGCDAHNPNIGASYIKQGVPQASKILLRFFFF